MSWYSTGEQAAEKLAATTFTRRSRNFFTRNDEQARIRFLKPASESFNYKRCFVPWAKGQKMLTSPEVKPDPFLECGKKLNLQASAAWPILDRRVFEFEDKETGEKKKSGPRILYFADGMKTRKALVAFEKQMLANENEEREENGQEPLTLEDYNLTHYDVTASKPKGSGWLFTAKRPKALSKEDNSLIEKAFGEMESAEWLARELEPLPVDEIKAILGTGGPTNNGTSTDDDDDGDSYSYSDDDDDTVSFED